MTFLSPYSPNMSSVHCLYSTSLDTSFTASQMTSIPNVASSRKFIRYLKGVKRGNHILSETSLTSRTSTSSRLINNSQGARVLFGERGQEDVGKVDEKGTDGLLGCVEKPGKDGADCVKSLMLHV